MTPLSLSGTIPPEAWNRLEIKLIPKLRAGSNLQVGVNFQVTLDAKFAKNAEQELRQILEELGLADLVRLNLSS